MAYLAQMPDIDTIQAENERILAAAHAAEQKGSDMMALRTDMQAAVETLPIKIGIGGIAVIVAVYWFLIRR